MSSLCFTIRFLQPYAHGRGEDGNPEWPPSPLRLFQALIASSLGREPDTGRREAAIAALRWLETLPPPEIIAPPASISRAPFRLFVPDNVGDKVARAWCAGRSADIAEYRTEKDIRPVHLYGDTLQYVFPAVEIGAHFPALQRGARRLSTLGWAIDTIVGDASIGTMVRLSGAEEHWLPGRRGSQWLRSPVAGTLDALERRHDQFLSRLEGDLFRPVSPLTVFDRIAYSRAADVEPRPHAVFRLVEPITGDRRAFETRTRSRDVAAWFRHGVAEVCDGWPFEPLATFVHGHRERGTPTNRRRFAYLPLPTINPRLDRVESVGRVMLQAPSGCERELEWASARLAGHDLVWKGQSVATLERLPEEDWVTRQYVCAAREWSTVTPVVLPGHDDRDARKGERLLHKALREADFSDDLIRGIEKLEWRKVGFRRGTDHASRYRVPDKTSGPTFHVAVRFAQRVTGPIAIGSGRFRGLGVFAAETERNL